MIWEPITLEALYNQILRAEEEMNSELQRFWELIKIFPEKWIGPEYGKEGGGFWVVAICGRNIIWYNDIEEGFNISPYKQYGEFEDYRCNQDDLQYPVQSLLTVINFGGDMPGYFAPPQTID
ncbi:hypothetical protein [Hymenobacter negativus]|uniref:SMI1/KNR4 family protein n=1 Tax=Hymenobacter negativus TaxID=2795026 RepID=A0ABS3QE00_9BACT|nr:hypothetical protein [Hymenobacter negativus]MBO2009448.1 hypothetical protein [Hymenobacter negativus]